MNRWLILFCAFLIFVSACKDDASKIDELAAECNADDQEACKKLADIAKNDEDEDIRKTAVEKLTDQTLIAEIACTGKYDAIRELALRTLIKVPKPIRSEAIAWLQQPLMEKHSDWEKNVRMALLQGIPEEQWPVIVPDFGVNISPPVDNPLPPGQYTFIVSYSVLNAKSEREVSFSETLELDCIYHFHCDAFYSLKKWSARIEFVCMGQECAFAAKNDKDSGVRTAAVKKLTDQALLADIAKKDKDSNVRMAAAEKLIDPTVAQSAFAAIAWNGNYVDVRVAAVKKLTDQKLLADIVNVTEEHIWAAAMDKITDQVLLADIARNDKNSDVRKAAERRLKALQGK